MVSEGIRKAVKTSTEKIRMGKAEGRRSKEGSGEQERGEEEEEETEKGKTSGSKESNGEVGNMGRGRRSSKVTGRGQEVSTGRIS